MPTVTINDKTITVPEGITIIQACELAEIEIPRFCYHERLAIAGNCRMCLVEVAGGPPKPVASCAMPIADGMKISTDSPMVKKAREGVMEFLLANHPLDCPICDQGGECDLQDQAYQYSSGKSRYDENKRSVTDKNMGPLIKTQMTRCIHCTRCVRFIEDVAGTVEIGAIGRGENMEITTYLEKSVTSELSGNVIDLCPVGALTSKPYAFKARSWELSKTETIDVMDALGSNIRVDSRGLEVMRILPRLNEEINEEWLSDKSRFCYDGLKYQRLDKSYIKKDGKLVACDFDEAVLEVTKKIKNLKGEEIAALTGFSSSVEEIFVLKTLLEKLGSRNYDCRLKGQKLSSKDRASYLFNSSIAGIEQADLCLIIATNPRKDSPVLNARIRKKFLGKNLKIYSIGVDGDLTYSHQNLGDDLAAIKDVLDEKSEISKAMKEAKNPMIILGEDAISGGDGFSVLSYVKKIAEKYNLVRGDWNGFNFLSKSSGLINGLEVGFDFAESSEILEKIEKEEIKLTILHGVDDDLDFSRLEKSFVIYIGSHGDKGAEIADVILPAAAYTEKEAIFVNIEGRAQSSKRVIFAPNGVKTDLEVLVILADKLGIDLGFKDPAQARASLAAANSNFSKIGEIKKANWICESDVPSQIDFKRKVVARDFDFYLTNPIARASRILSRCSHQIQNN